MPSIMNILRTTVYSAIAILVFQIYQTWLKEHPAPVQSTVTTSETVPVQNNNDVLPVAIQQAASGVPSSQVAENINTRLAQPVIRVTTDVLEATINPVGGNLTGIKLLDFAAELHSKKPVQLLNDNPATRYIAVSGILGKTDSAGKQIIWVPEKTDYTFAPGENRMDVKMHYRDAAGVLFTKIYTFHRNDYAVNVSYQIQNLTTAPWFGSLYLKLSRTNSPPEKKHGLSGFTTYFGGALSTPDRVYQKISFSDMKKSTVDQTAQNGWIAMVQHYFVGAWVPEKGTDFRYFSQVSPDGLYTLGALSPGFTVQPHSTVTTGAAFYAGPATADLLEKVAPHLKLTIDYGWLWMISGAIFWLMQKIYAVVRNWGWSIVLVTLIIKLAFYHLSAKSYRSMSALRRLQPKINALRERYGDDRQKLTQATLELYRTEKVNPMSGCLPVLIQIPVFIALYWVLVESVQLRQAPFILWIHDLSAADPYYILPVLMGLSMFIQQRLSPAPPDPTQAKVMMLMPIFFTAMFASFPAGLMLYWFVNNSLSCLQQWYVMRTTAADVAHKHDKKKR